MTNGIILGAEATLDASSMTKGLKNIDDLVQSLEKSMQSLSKTAENLSTAMEKATKAGSSKNNAVADGLEKQAKAAGKAKDSLNPLITKHQVAAKHGALLANAWNEGSNVINNRYLNSIKDLRQGLQRVQQEFKTTSTYHNGYIKSMDSMELAHTRFMIKGNLITRTLDNISSKMINMGKNAQWTGRQLMVGVTAPIAGLATVAVKTALEIEKLDVSLKKISASFDDASMKDLDAQTREYATSLGVARSEIKNTQLEFARLGFSISDIKKATEETTKLSLVGDVNVSDATRLIQILRQSQTAAERAAGGWESIHEQLVKVNAIDKATNGSIKDLTGAMAEVYPTAKRFNMTLAETAAVMVGLTQGGFSAG